MTKRRRKKGIDNVNDFDVRDAERAYRLYEADKLLVNADPTLTSEEKANRITQLTDELFETEATLGVTWHSIGGVTVTATSSSTANFPIEETETDETPGPEAA